MARISDASDARSRRFTYVMGKLGIKMYDDKNEGYMNARNYSKSSYNESCDGVISLKCEYS